MDNMSENISPALVVICTLGVVNMVLSMEVHTILTIKVGQTDPLT